MRKALRELEGCLCEQTEDTEVILDHGDFTYIGARKDKHGLVLFAWGEGEAEYKPNYCPFCGELLKEQPETMIKQAKVEDYWAKKCRECELTEAEKIHECQLCRQR